MSSAVFLSTEGKKIVAERRAMARGGFAQRRSYEGGPGSPSSAIRCREELPSDLTGGLLDLLGWKFG